MTIPQASILALNYLGIARPPGFDGTFATFGTLDAEDRIRVTRWVKNYVEDHPTLFTPAEVNVAVTLGDVSDPLNEEFDYSLFWSEVGSNANNLVGVPLANIGESASLIAKAIPLLIIAGAAYFFLINKQKLKL